ncbi:MAG: DMT family transporter [Betaproteobacteria bacterium]|jgi:drug/metabolite transporter (DMT)-like permease|nr:DMT family transporter [Betaproteobacteria bacterium]NBP43677.1 DMT family transporter [Betaproteobacteria bacterium]
MTFTPKSASWLSGVAFTLGAMASFAVLDTTSKFILMSQPVMLLIFVRYLVQSALTTAYLVPKRGLKLFKTRMLGWHIVRGLLLVACSLMAVLSFMRMPLAEFAAVVLITPLVVTLMARFLLGEHVPAFRWACVFTGLLGALIIVRPGGSLNWLNMWLPLLLVVANSLFQILTSRMTRTEDPLTIHFYTNWVGTLIAGVAMGNPGNLELPLTNWLLMLFSGALGAFAHYLLILAYSRAPASQLTPFMYSNMVFTALCGWLAFSEVPQGLALVGMALIAVSGIAAGVHAAYFQQPRLVPTQETQRQ